MAPKRDIGGCEHANAVRGSKNTIQWCHCCGKFIHCGTTTFKRHIAGRVEAYPGVPPEGSLMKKKHLNDGGSERAPNKKRKATLVDDGENTEKELERLEKIQLKLVLEESRCMAVLNGLDVEEKLLNQALQESRFTAFLDEERRNSIGTVCPTAAYWAGLVSGNCGSSSSTIGMNGTAPPAMNCNSSVSPLEGRPQKERGNATLEKYFVDTKKEVKHQNVKAIQKRQSDSELETLLIEKEQLLAQVEELNQKLSEKGDELEEMEALNQILILKESSSNLELQDARKELMSVLANQLETARIGIKRMGEIEQKPFADVCSKKYPHSEWEIRTMEAVSSWQEKVNNPNWHPFKNICKDGKWQEIIDEDDSELKELRHRLGKAAYIAVSNALLELNEYNPSGRYVVQELWNFKERRKASLKEVVQCLAKKMKKLGSCNG